VAGLLRRICTTAKAVKKSGDRQQRAVIRAMIVGDGTPELRADAGRMNLAVEPSTGEQVAALLRQIYATPKSVVEKAAAASKGR
jgi:hypothetical protein